MAERFSRFRDAGTGIQVFLPPVPPTGQGSPLVALLLPISVVLGFVRVALLVAIVLAWTLLSTMIGNLGRPLQSAIHSVFGRLFLLFVGFVWITKETVSLRSRGRAAQAQAKPLFNPQKGDLILCNWSSWVDVLVLLIAFNPTFVRPVVQERLGSGQAQTEKSNSPSATNRRKGAAARGQQHAEMAKTASEQGQGSGEARLLGWTEVSFAVVMLESGLCPPTGPQNALKSLDEILQHASGPVVVFPELVTSNNRGLLRFESILPHSWRSLFRATGALRIGKGQSNIFIMSIKHEPPSVTAPSTTLSVPAAPFSPLPHIVKLCFAPSTYSLTVRQLTEDESPTHASYIADAHAVQRPNALSDKCADLMSSL